MLDASDSTGCGKKRAGSQVMVCSQSLKILALRREGRAPLASIEG
jgi:hypothetical protein